MRRVTDESIERIAALLPAFDVPSLELIRGDPDGTIFSGYLCAPVVDRLVASLYEEGFVQSFDWMDWQAVAERYVVDPWLVERAPVTTLQRLLTTHVRRDRFHDGHLANMIETGHILAILRRLARIADLRRQRKRKGAG